MTLKASPQKATSNKVPLIIIAICVLVIVIFGYGKRDFFKDALTNAEENNHIQKQLEYVKTKIDPDNKEQLEALRNEIKGYVTAARDNATDYSKMTPDEFIQAEIVLLQEISQQIATSISEYKLGDNVSTFEKIRPQLLQNAGKWGVIIKYKDSVSNKQEFNAARTKKAEEIKKVLNELGQNQGKLQIYADGMLNSLMFKRILDEVSERGKFTNKNSDGKTPVPLEQLISKGKNGAVEQPINK